MISQTPRLEMIFSFRIDSRSCFVRLPHRVKDWILVPCTVCWINTLRMWHWRVTGTIRWVDHLPELQTLPDVYFTSQERTWGRRRSTIETELRQTEKGFGSFIIYTSFNIEYSDALPLKQRSMAMFRCINVRYRMSSFWDVDYYYYYYDPLFATHPMNIDRT